MNLQEQQKLIAGYLANSNDNIEENTFIRSLNSDELNRFRDSLLRKRFRAVSTILPLTFKLADEDLFERFSLYSKSYLPDGVDKHFKDAFKFREFLLPRLKEFPKSVLAYESSMLSFSLKRTKFLLLRLSWSSEAILRLNEKSTKKTFIIGFRSLIIELSKSGIKRL